MLRDILFNQDDDDQESRPLQKRKVVTQPTLESEELYYSKEEVQFLINELENLKKWKENIALEGPRKLG